MKLNQTNFVKPFEGMQFKKKHNPGEVFTVLQVQEDCGLFWVKARSSKHPMEVEFCWSLLMRFDMITEIHIYYQVP